MVKKMFFLCFTVFLAIGLLFVPTASQAIPFLDFQVQGPYLTTAGISYAGGSSALVGTDISIVDVIGLGTPSNNGVDLAISNGMLNFATGNFTGSSVNQWSFGSGGIITITGGIGALGIPDGTILLTGAFLSADVTSELFNFKIAGASFIDQKLADLVEFYGLTGDINYAGNLNISFFANGSPPAGFSSSDLASGDVTNTPAPEPGTMLLFGLGVIGVAMAKRMSHQ